MNKKARIIGALRLDLGGYRTAPAYVAKIHGVVTTKVKAEKPIGEWNTFHVVIKDVSSAAIAIVDQQGYIKVR
ncbi:hypothetical protein [Prosthecobacter sp.]|uniref:hypothetical protein n=1 Tax=Prosthecobacter sp. TaxID=1965333 RepID=UPI003783F102